MKKDLLQIILLISMFGIAFECFKHRIETEIQSPNDKWAISEEPTLLIWNKADITKENLQADDPPCGIGFEKTIGEIYENYGRINVTLAGKMNYENVDSNVINLFENYGYKDQQEANAFEIWTKVSYKTVQSNKYVYVEKKK